MCLCLCTWHLCVWEWLLSIWIFVCVCGCSYSLMCLPPLCLCGCTVYSHPGFKRFSSQAMQLGSHLSLSDSYYQALWSLSEPVSLSSTPLGGWKWRYGSLGCCWSSWRLMSIMRNENLNLALNPCQPHPLKSASRYMLSTCPSSSHFTWPLQSSLQLVLSQEKYCMLA